MRQIVTETAVSYGLSKDCAACALAMAANDAAAQGVTKIDMRVKLLIPVPIYKEKIADFKEAVENVCAQRQFRVSSLAGIRSTLSRQCIVLATAFGEASEESMHPAGAASGQEIIQIGYAGLEGSLRMAQESRQDAAKRFSTAFLTRLFSYGSCLFMEDAVREISRAGVFTILQVKDGGVLAALYQLGEETGLGLKIDLRKIPILQESVEICEYFRKNPYQMTSAGTFIALTDSAEDVLKICRCKEIPAAKIGVMTKDGGKIIQNQEEEQYINRPATDELMNFYTGGF